MILGSLDVPGPPNYAGTLVRSIPTQFNRFWDIPGTFKKLFIFVHSVHSGNLGCHFGLPTVRSSSHCPYQLKLTNKNAGTQIKGPKSLSQVWFQKSGYLGEKLGQFWNQAIVTVLDVPGPPNFAGTLVRSIPTQFNRFWDISGTFKKLFIFVHSVHSGNLGRHFGLPTVRSSSHCPYQS